MEWDEVWSKGEHMTINKDVKSESVKDIKESKLTSQGEVADITAGTKIT